MIIFALLSVSVSLAESYPQPTGYVNDFAGVLNETQRIQLGTLLADLERNTTAEIAVVTVNSTDDPFSYSVGLFQAWGIGQEENDNGILIFYAKSQNRIEVRTGYGVEGILPDSKVGRILDDYYVPMRDANLVAEGIVATTEQLASVVYANADEVRAGTAGASTSIFTIIGAGITQFFWLIIFFVIFVPVIFRGRAPKCPVDKIRMDVVKTESISAGFGRYNEIVYYKCKICGRTAQRKRARGGFFVMAGGHGGGGFGGGGFGGGGTGGGGAGR